MAPPALASLSDDSDYTGNTVDVLAVSEGTLNESATWKDINVPYRVTGNIGVTGDGNKLVIEAGAEFEFDENKPGRRFESHPYGRRRRCESDHFPRQ